MQTQPTRIDTQLPRRSAGFWHTRVISVGRISNTRSRGRDALSTTSWWRGRSCRGLAPPPRGSCCSSSSGPSRQVAWHGGDVWLTRGPGPVTCRVRRGDTRQRDRRPEGARAHHASRASSSNARTRVARYSSRVVPHLSQCAAIRVSGVTETRIPHLRIGRLPVRRDRDNTPG